MELLERASFLDALCTHLAGAARRGVFVLVGGEAGIGKTSLVRAFAEQHRAAVRLLWGACDAQFTPRALGPLLDVAEQVGGPLEELLRSDASRDEVFAAFLRELQRGTRTNLVVFEDIHWADDATLDLLRFVARRLPASKTLLLATYRSDEVRPALQVVLGDLASLGGLHRLDLSPLSQAAVGALAEQHALDAAEVYRATGGNPFFVTEVLASPDAQIPPSVRDAVLARAARLSNSARAAIDAAALIGARVDVALLDRAVAPQPGALEECLASGVLEVSGRDVAFRHELSRTALEAAVSPSQRLALHRRILDAMAAAGPGTYDPARLAYHAEQAGDATAVLEYAIAAARRAALVDAHREAAAQYGRALRFASGLPPEALGPMLRALSYECSVTANPTEAVAAARGALECFRVLGDTRAEGDTCRWLSRTLWLANDRAGADAAGRAAVELLERLPDGPELAMAYSNMSQLGMLAWAYEEAEAWGRRAIDLAQRLDDTETLVHALNNVGSARLYREQADGRELVEESVRAARAAGLHDEVARALCNLMELDTIARQLARADRYADEVLAHVEAHDLGEHELYARSWRAQIRVMQGRWAEALDEALPIMTRPAIPAYIKVLANTVVARVWARRGEPGADDLLDEALALIGPDAELQWSVPLRTVRAEVAWLAGDQKRAEAEVETVFEEHYTHSWFFGEVVFWLWKAGGLENPPEGVADPFALQMAGEWDAAAAQWDALGCPYEAALARADADDEAVLRQALDELQQLGAEPAARIIARRLRTLGARAVPRGPRASTRANAAQITRRELDVLNLVAEGLRNADIAERLFLSPKTVDHHVSSVLVKLGVRTRGEAANEARRLGLLSEVGER